METAVVSKKCKLRQSHFNFLKNDYWVSLFLEKQLSSQNIFLVKSKLSITTYLFLVFYKSTFLQSQSFLKNIEIFLKKQKSTNNCSVPSRQQSQIYDTFSKNIETFSNLSVAIVSQKYRNFLCKQKTVNNRIIPSTHAVRKITILSDDHSFTLHPSLSPY